MSKEMLVIALGIWIVIVPYLGIPSSWKTILFVLSGLGLVLVGFFLRTEALARGDSRREHQPFVDNSAPTSEPRPYERKEGITSLN